MWVKMKARLLSHFYLEVRTLPKANKELRTPVVLLSWPRFEIDLMHHFSELPQYN